MGFKIAVASGKGGTGKTSVAVNLYYHMVQRVSDNIQLVDCDVEEPNDLIFFGKQRIVSEEERYQRIPEIDESACTFCRKCAEYCEFNALTIIPPVKYTQVSDVLCHSCGACSVACNFGAITEIQHSIGTITNYDVGYGKGLLEGKLRIGSAMQTMLIKDLKKEVAKGNDITIFDAPPGTSCSVVETVVEADYVVLVTEPTPFGLNDLKLTMQLMWDLRKPFGVVINKAGLGNSDTYQYLKENSIDIIGEIPFMREFAKSYADGNLWEQMPASIVKCYSEIVSFIDNKVLVNEGNHHS